MKEIDIIMVSNKLFPLSTLSNNNHDKEALINIGNSEKSTTSLTEHYNCILQYTAKYFAKCSFLLIKIFIAFVKL